MRAAECMKTCTKKRLFIDYHNSDNHDYVSGSELSALCRNAVRANIRNTTPPISVTIYKVGGKGFIHDKYDGIMLFPSLPVRTDIFWATIFPPMTARAVHSA